MLVPELCKFCGGSLSQLGPESIDARWASIYAKGHPRLRVGRPPTPRESSEPAKPEPEPLVSMSCAKLFLQPSHAVELPQQPF